MAHVATRVVAALTHPKLKSSKEEIGNFKVVKVNKIGSRLKRTLTVDPLQKQIFSKGGKELKTIHLDEVNQITPNLKSLTITISFKPWAVNADKDRVYRFEKAEALLEFCLVAALISPHTIPESLMPGVS